eukprot:5669635-Prymnesium_polylepis.1
MVTAWQDGILLLTARVHLRLLLLRRREHAPLAQQLDLVARDPLNLWRIRRRHAREGRGVRNHALGHSWRRGRTLSRAAWRHECLATRVPGDSWWRR